MRATQPQMKFQKLSEADLPLLAESLARPHVAAWWHGCESLEEVRAEFLPLLADDSSVIPYLAYYDDVAVGYFQSYVAIAAGDGWWPDERDPGVRGIDQFLADGERLGQGIGTQMVRDFALFLFRDPSVTRIQADPAPTNARAIRCYEKAGFRRAGLVTTPDGPAMLMTMERPE